MAILSHAHSTATVILPINCVSPVAKILDFLLLLNLEVQPIPMKIPVLDLKPQYASIKAEIQAAIDRVLESGQFIVGPEVKLFEQEVATYMGAKHAIAVNSGTDALVIGLRALGIGEGDEVITTPFSFFATAESISWVESSGESGCQN
jgi:hypothetical protein